MKKLILFFLVTIIGGMAWAATPSVWRSSYTATADTTLNLCGPLNGFNPTKRGLLHGVVISSAAAAGGSLTIYNSSAAAVAPMTVLNLSETGAYYYDVVASTPSRGLTYSTSIAGAKVTLLFDCY